MADDSNSVVPVKRRQKVHRLSSNLALACVLALVLMLSSVIVALPLATAQNAPSGGTSQGEGRETQGVVPSTPSEAADDSSKALTKEEGEKDKKFELVEATIEDIHEAIKTNQITCTELVQQYIDRAKAYNGVCTQLVTEDGAPIPAATGAIRAGSPLEFPTNTVPASGVLPDLDQYTGLPLDFGRMEATASDPSVQQQTGMRVGISNAGQLNALETINIRGERSVTCQGAYDAHPSTGPLPEGAPAVCEEFRQQPDALERAAELDAQYGSNPPLDGLPMYCIPIAFKDPYDTKDMRSTANNDVNFAMDVPPFDSTIASQVREKGGIIYAKASAHEFNAGPGNPGGPATATTAFPSGAHAISSWSGQACNPYDTERETRGSSSGSGVAVSANLVTVAICEQTFASCQGPASRNNLVNILTTKGVLPDSGGIGNQFFIDRPGIYGKTVKDAAFVLDAIKDPERGYFDPRDIYTALPKALIPEEPYTSFVIDDEDLKKNSKPLEGMRIGIVRDFMVKHSQNDVATSDQINEEIKNVLRDQLGAEIVESFDPLYDDDPDVPNMKYTFQDAFSEILPRLMPEVFSRTNSTGDLEFAVPGHNVTSYDYLLQLSRGEAPLSDNLNLRTLIGGFPNTLTFKFEIEKYLLDRGDDRVKDWASWFANARWREDSQRAGAENWLYVNNTVSEGKTGQLAMSYAARLAILKVMEENNIDAFVNPENTLPPRKIGGPSEPTVKGRGAVSCCGSLTAVLQIPQIVVPAGYNQIVYEPRFALNAAKTNYIGISGPEQSLLPHPMPISMMFWAGPGEEPTLLKVASAYEAATHHRTPPPDFGPLPTFPIEHMSNTTASAGYGVYAQKPARAEYVTNSSQLVGDEIDSITLRMKSVGTINGTAEIGILNEDLSVKKLFGTLDVTTLTPTYTDYEFKLTNDGDELYTIESGDRIGIKYEGGGFDETSWVSVMLDLDAEDPFDGANSYLQYHYQGSWRQSPDRDIHMVLKQTTAGDGAPPPPPKTTFIAQLDGDQEVPPRDTDASGSAVFMLNDNKTALQYKLNVTNIYNVTAAHIHVAPAGVNGPIVVPLFSGNETGPVNGVLAEGAIMSADLTGPLAGMTIDDLVAEFNSGNTYVNVHTSKYPGGEIRGQIS